MARQARIEYEGAFYHVMARGDRREPIFEDEPDRLMFLETLGECCRRSGWRVYAWVLMSNHYHLVLQTPGANLVSGMKWFQNTYTRRLNTRHGKWGHVFGGRYKAVVVEEDGTREYLTTLIDYVHLNPVRARLIRREGGQLLDYEWSSLTRGYAILPKHRADWLAVAEGLELFGCSDRTADRRHFLERLELLVLEDRGQVSSPHEGLQNRLERGWYWGSQAFREKLLKFLPRRIGNRNYRSSKLGREQEEAEAEKWIGDACAHFETSLETAPHVIRVCLAWTVHQRTNQPQSWIAHRLGLRTAANVSQQVRRFSQRSSDGEFKGERQISSWIRHVRSC